VDIYRHYVVFIWLWIGKQFTPRHASVDDPVGARLDTWRAILGPLTVALAAVLWSQTTEVAEDNISWIIAGPFLQAPIALAAVLLSVPVVAAISPQETVWTIVRRLARPFLLATSVTAAVTALVVVVRLHAISAPWFVIVTALLLPVAVATLWYGNKYMFGAADAHPLVAVVAGVLVAGFGLSPLAFTGRPSFPSAPAWIHVLLSASGPVLLLLINIWGAARWWRARRISPPTSLVSDG
jgi:hypothetical protein